MKIFTFAPLGDAPQRQIFGLAPGAIERPGPLGPRRRHADAGARKNRQNGKYVQLQSHAASPIGGACPGDIGGL